MKKRQFAGCILAVLSFLFILLFPEIGGLSAEGQRCLAVFVLVFFLYAFEVLNAAVVSLMIVPLLSVLHIVPVKDALSGFASTSTYLIVGAFFITAAMVKSRVGDRMAYHILLLVGTGATQISFGIMCINVVLAFMIPSSTARTAMMIPICLKIIDQYPGSEKTKFGANIMMTLCCTNSTISAGILTSTITNPMAVDYIEKVAGCTISYKQWLLWGGIPAAICTLLSWMLIQIIFRVKGGGTKIDASYIRKKLDELGKISLEEIRVLIILFVAVVMWFVGEELSIDSTTVCLICACLLCIPKIGNLTWKDCKNNVSLSVMFVVSGGISLGTAMCATGTATWLAETIFNLFGLSHFSVNVLMIALIIIVQFMHVFFAGTATMANVFFPVIAGIAMVSGASPVVLILISAFMIGGYPILMFFNTTPNILCYDTGYLKAGDFIKIGLCVSVAVCAIYIACLELYWPAVGML